MNGLNWTALPIVCDILGVVDVELYVQQLVTLRDRGKKGNP